MESKYRESSYKFEHACSSMKDQQDVIQLQIQVMQQEVRESAKIVHQNHLFIEQSKLPSTI